MLFRRSKFYKIMKINEIAYADGILPLNWSLLNLNDAVVIQSIDGKDIQYLSFDNYSVYFITDKNKKIQAYAVIELVINEFCPLVRVENIAKIKGLITIIIFAITMSGIKLVIKNTEELTNDGLKWICKLLSSDRTDFIIKDQNGHIPNIAKLKSEHLTAKLNLRAKKDQTGSTAIFITNQNHPTLIKKINENTEIYKEDRLIYPNPTFLNSKDLW